MISYFLIHIIQHLLSSQGLMHFDAQASYEKDSFPISCCCVSLLVLRVQSMSLNIENHLASIFPTRPRKMIKNKENQGKLHSTHVAELNLVFTRMEC